MVTSVIYCSVDHWKNFESLKLVAYFFCLHVYFWHICWEKACVHVGWRNACDAGTTRRRDWNTEDKTWHVGSTSGGPHSTRLRPSSADHGEGRTGSHAADRCMKPMQCPLLTVYCLQNVQCVPKSDTLLAFEFPTLVRCITWWFLLASRVWAKLELAYFRWTWSKSKQLVLLWTCSWWRIVAWYQSQVSQYIWTLQQDGAPSHTAKNTLGLYSSRVDTLSTYCVNQ